MKDAGLLPGLMVFTALVWVGCGCLFISQRHREDLRLQMRLFLWAFSLRFALSIVIYQLGLVSVIGDDDSGGWIFGVWQQDRWLRQGVGLWDLPSVMAGAFKGQHLGYEYLLALFFYLTQAPYRLPAAALNGFFGALIVVFTYRAARYLFSGWVARCTGWWACLLPSMLIWSAQTIKEPSVILLETMALYGCIRLQRSGPSLRHLALCAGTIMLLLAFRFYAAFVVAGAVLLALLLRALVQGRTAVATVGLVALMVPMVVSTGVFSRHAAELEKYDLKRVQKFRQDVSSGGSKWGGRSGVRTVDIRTPAGFVQGVAVGAAHLLLAPFPWEMGGASIRMLLTLPELLVWWWLFFIGVVPGLRTSLRHRLLDISPMLLLMVGLGLVYSLMFGNVGLVFRQRAQLLPWLLIFAAVGLEQRRLRRAAARELPMGRQALAAAPR